MAEDFFHMILISAVCTLILWAVFDLATNLIPFGRFF